MSAEIHDLRAIVGTEAYANYLKREIAERKWPDHEVARQTILSLLWTVAMQNAMTWVTEFGETAMITKTPEQLVEFAHKFARELLEETAQTYEERLAVLRKFQAKS